jgi:hypothetical protein
MISATTLVGVEYGTDTLFHPKLVIFNLTLAGRLKAAREWGKLPAEQVEGVPPHKRVRCLTYLNSDVFNLHNEEEIIKLAIEKNFHIAIPWGCWNIERKDSYLVQNGWTADGRRIMIPHKDVGSKECKYTLERSDDPSCKGCKFKKSCKKED